VSNFEQIVAASRHRLHSASVGVGHKASRLVGESVMSKADEFRHFADEAMRWARHSTSPKEQLALINLARTWTQAAERNEHPVAVKKLPPEHRAA
jgi:hypothetical protein